MKGEAFSNQKEFEGKVLKALFDGLAERRVRYAVLRNYEDLPQSVGARDIDIVLHPDDLQATCALVMAIVQDMGLRYGNLFADERLTQFALVRRNAEGGLQQIKIDFFIRSEAYGIELLSADAMLKDAWMHNGVSVVPDHILLLDKWIFHLLVGKPLHPKYDADFAQISEREKQPLIQSLSRFLPALRAEEVVTVLAEGKGSTLVLAGNERLAALRQLWLEQGLTAFLRSLRFIAFRLRDMLRPHGVFLSVSGPDGSGKTTVIDMVIQQLGEIYGNDAVTYAHFRPTVLPRIAEMAKEVRAVKTVDENYNQPHRAEPSGVVGSAARLIYYWLDYFAGYFRRTFPVLKRREVVLFDRYYYDMIADPFRSRINLPMPVLRLVGRLLPLPRFAFFIRVAPDEILRRKQELTMERVVTLNARYGDLAQRGWLIPIDNDGAPEEAAAAIVDHIVSERDRKARRVLQRMIK